MLYVKYVSWRRQLGTDDFNYVRFSPVWVFTCIYEIKGFFSN